MKQRQLQRPQEAGFTLVELSIVLVIIGLIVGGVLAGQDMIRAAEIRATISQIEEFNTATNTFRDKYRVMPGDIASSAATNFNLPDAAARTATAAANQNGLLECDVATLGCADVKDFGGETAMFWVDLSSKNLIENSLTTALADISGGYGALSPGAVNVAGTTGDLLSFFPEAKLGKGNYITVFSASGRNFYQLTGIASVAATGIYTLVPALNPQDAFNIDAKMDDGRPISGTVRAVDAIAELNQAVDTMDPGSAAAIEQDRTATGTVGLCVEDGANPADGVVDYNTYTDDEASSPACELRLMFN